MSAATDLVEQVVADAHLPYLRASGISYGQKFASDLWQQHFNQPTPNSYPSAAAAYRASEIASIVAADAPAGAFHYFDTAPLHPFGHVLFALGDGLGAAVGTETAEADYSFGKDVYAYRIEAIAGRLRYLGWSLTNGDRAPIVLE